MAVGRTVTRMVVLCQIVQPQPSLAFRQHSVLAVYLCTQPEQNVVICVKNNVSGFWLLLRNQQLKLPGELMALYCEHYTDTIILWPQWKLSLCSTGWYCVIKLQCRCVIRSLYLLWSDTLLCVCVCVCVCVCDKSDSLHVEPFIY